MADSNISHHVMECTVKVAPADVFAGADLSLKGEVRCSQGCDLTGHSLLIKNQDDILIDRVELTHFDSGSKVNETDEVVAKAPLASGAYTWAFVFAAHEQESLLHDEASAEVSFTVKPHATSMTIWGVPPTVSSGDKFTAIVGIKCLAHCRLSGPEVEIHDHEETQNWRGRVGAEPWTGTTALYFAEAELSAPIAEGYYRWHARLPEFTWQQVQHEGDHAAFGVRVVGPSDCVVRVEAIDKDDNDPIKGAHVVLHPYRGITDEHGVFEIRVPKGEYRLCISGLRYAPFETSVEVNGDMATKAELTWQPDMDEYEVSSVPQVREQTRLRKAKQEKQQLRAKQKGAL